MMMTTIRDSLRRSASFWHRRPHSINVDVSSSSRRLLMRRIFPVWEKGAWKYLNKPTSTTEREREREGSYVSPAVKFCQHCVSFWGPLAGSLYLIHIRICLKYWQLYSSVQIRGTFFQKGKYFHGTFNKGSIERERERADFRSIVCISVCVCVIVACSDGEAGSSAPSNKSITLACKTTFFPSTDDQNWTDGRTNRRKERIERIEPI